MSASPVTPALRDRLMTAFRAYLCEKIDFVPFQHQAAWWASTDGQVLGPDDTGPHTMTVRLPSRRVVARTITPRPQGRARVVADLGAYKSGKSAGAGIWAAAFAAVPVLYAIATTSFFMAIGYLGPMRSSLVMNLEPVASILFGILLLGQILTPIQLGGAAIVIAAVVAVKLDDLRKPAKT